MTDRKNRSDFADEAPSDEEIAAAAAKLSEAWARQPDTQRVTETGQILQTLEKGRSNMVAVEVKRSRRIPRRD
ncbi:MAG: hypothetical protein IMF05_11955 [Proteobacteria bacterium]|jgi:hypothetical protein|nr:hypothetical protein [Pseudomonadota bacterium]MCK5273600.1 hypothetical protein [Alphaproteobacteria bacterium]